MSNSALLRGLQPQPLAGYLGALGVLRIAAAHAGEAVRGAFSDHGFVVHGRSRTELIKVLLDGWQPSPVLSPWNNASGFYDSSKGRQAKAAMDEIMASGVARLAPLIDAIQQVRSLVETAGYAEAPADDDKARFIGQLRNVLSDEALHWLDAVAVVEAADARMMPMLGSGGNEGVLDYSGLFLRSLVEVLLGDRARSERLLCSALDGTASHDLIEGPGGQFDPGVAGGFNTGPGFETKDLPKNPWAFLLLIEGSLVWASALATRQQGLDGAYRFAVSPFTVRHRAAGHGSAGRADNDPQRVRAEVWVPIWRKPATINEIARFVGEGRAEVSSSGGTRLERASNSLDFVDAVASLGVDRGVSSFVRYALIKRRGDSYIALPAGRVDVRYRREVDLVRQLDGQMDLLDGFFARFPSEEGAPAQLLGLRRAVDEARFAVSAHGGAGTMLALVRAVGALEMNLARRDPAKDPKLHRPLGGLSTDWIAACGDAPEVHIAAAFASLARTGGAGQIRAYLAQVDPARAWQFAQALRPRVWAGMSLSDRLAAVLHRRLLDVTRGPGDAVMARNPTWGTRPVSLQHVAVFLTPGVTDDPMLEELLFGFTWIRWDETVARQQAVASAPPLPRTYSLLKLLFLPSGIRVGTENIAVTPDPAIVPLLRAGRIAEAVDIARRQLLAKGFRARRLDAEAPVDASQGRRLAAALLLPVHPVSRLRREALIEDETIESTTEEPADVS